MLINTTWHMQLALIWRPNQNVRWCAKGKRRERARNNAVPAVNAPPAARRHRTPLGRSGIVGYLENDETSETSARYRVHGEHLITDDRFPALARFSDSISPTKITDGLQACRTRRRHGLVLFFFLYVSPLSRCSFAKIKNLHNRTEKQEPKIN